LDIAIYPIFEPYRGTPIYNDCINDGVWRMSEYKNNLLVEQDEIWEPNTVSRENLVKLSRYAFRSFYFRPYFLVSFAKIFGKLPFNRKMKMLLSAYNYFLKNGFCLHEKKYNHGSRFR